MDPCGEVAGLVVELEERGPEDDGGGVGRCLVGLLGVGRAADGDEVGEGGDGGAFAVVAVADCEG